ncbi:hypothetical protein A0H81_02363 [Grifola frondosa]|uniref:Uncharacterized protein n=1 Tax=Grifola frondosa TaxID=5627 RepID=A0A1C7MMR4_GRIFR|nr:hypothetical protein A0H81_02363 [Grifola frondosa]
MEGRKTRPAFGKDEDSLDSDDGYVDDDEDDGELDLARLLVLQSDSIPFRASDGIFIIPTAW